MGDGVGGRRKGEEEKREGGREEGWKVQKGEKEGRKDGMKGRGRKDRTRRLRYNRSVSLLIDRG